MSRFKEILKLTGNLISGSAEQFNFEWRLYNATSLILAVFIVVANFANAAIGLHIMVIYLGWIAFLLSLCFYYRSRVKGIFDNLSIRLFVGFSSLLGSSIYFFNSGLDGPMIYIMIMFFMLFSIMAPLHLQKEVLFVLGGTVLGILAYEYYSPESVTRYTTRTERYIDNLASICYTMVFTFLILRAFKISYSKERQTVLEQNETLAAQRKQLELQTHALQESILISQERNVFIETLLRELSHRVKNNLQVVVGLLSLQSNQLTDLKAKAAIEDSKRRLLSILILHQRLYRDDLHVDVEMSQYLKELTDTILAMSSYGDFPPEINLQMEKINLSVDLALPVGLILNELLSNSLKHAFSIPGSGHRVEISLTETDSNYKLNYSDNGNWIPADSNETRKSFGLHLVSILCRQIGAEYVMKQEHGTRIELLFPANRTVVD